MLRRVKVQARLNNMAIPDHFRISHRCGPAQLPLDQPVGVYIDMKFATRTSRAWVTRN